MPQMTFQQAHELALKLQNEKQFAEAESLYRQLLAHAPENAEVLCNLGTLHQAQGRLPEAIAAYESALRINPSMAVARFNLGSAYSVQNNPTAAAEQLRAAVKLAPELSPAYPALGDLMMQRFDAAGAIEAYRCASDHQPQVPELHVKLGNAYHAAARLDDAMAEYRQAIALRPGWALPHYNLALTLLIRGEFAEGFAEHEWRWKVDQLKLNPSLFPQPRWDGSDPAGRHILLECEQGFGDTIQFSRFASQLHDRGARITLACPVPLVGVMKTVPGVDATFTDGDRIPAADLRCSLLSLPRLLGITLETIPADVPYVRADPAKVAAWRARFAPYAGKRKIGIAWAGRAEQFNDATRSMPGSALAPLKGMDGVQFFSLQKAVNPRGGTPAIEMVDWTGDLTDFAETAAMMECLDLIITVDTATAHLAGALGRPTWVLLSRMPDWRWFLDRSDCPWYPTARLFRQTTLGDFSAPIRAVREALLTGSRPEID